MATTVAKLLEIAYGSVSVRIILDGGVDTEREASKMRARYGDRIKVDVLAFPEVEMYFTPAALGKWLAAKGLPPDQIKQQIQGLGAGRITKSFLNRLHQEQFGTSYQVVQGAHGIASFMEEADLAGLAPLLLDLAEEGLGNQWPSP